MNLEKIKEKIKNLVDENYNEHVLNEVRNILELSTNGSYKLTSEQKQELDALEKRYDKGELKTYTWEEVKQRLIENWQLKVLKERILKEEKGKGVYLDAREVIQEIKMKMKHV